MKLQEYKQLVTGKLGIRQDTVKQQRDLIRWMIDHNMNDPNHGITIDRSMMDNRRISAGLRLLMPSLWTAERRVLIVRASRDSGCWGR